MKAGRTRIRGKEWTRETSIATEKFDTIVRAIQASLTDEPVPFSTLVDRVAALVPDFEGSVAWYTITCARELEVRGALDRRTGPVRYAWPAKALRREPAG